LKIFFYVVSRHRVPRPFSRKDFAADPADQGAPRLFERSLSMLSLTSPPTFPDPPVETTRPDNPLSQSLTLQNHAAMMGFNNTMSMILPVKLSLISSKYHIHLHYILHRFQSARK
jgi:hypothetical protein